MLRPGWMIAALSLLAVRGGHAPVYVYRLEITEVATIDDGEKPIVDTIVVAAVFSVSLVDSAVMTHATVVVDSSWYRHSTGPRSSDTLELDGNSAGTTYALRLRNGRVVSGTPQAPSYPIPASISYVSASLAYLFPALRNATPIGATQTDTTKSNGTTAVHDCTVIGESGGLLHALIRDSTSAIATNPEGESVKTESRTTQDVSSTVAGPVASTLIRRDVRGTGSSTVDPVPLSFLRSTVTRLTRVR